MSDEKNKNLSKKFHKHQKKIVDDGIKTFIAESKIIKKVLKTLCGKHLK